MVKGCVTGWILLAWPDALSLTAAGLYMSLLSWLLSAAKLGDLHLSSSRRTVGIGGRRQIFERKRRNTEMVFPDP